MNESAVQPSFVHMKTIKVWPEIHQELLKIKAETGKKTISETIQLLLEVDKKLRGKDNGRVL